MKILKLATITLPLLAAASLQAAQTNLVQNLVIGLLANVEGPTTTNGDVLVRTTNVRGLSTFDVIKLLGDATSKTFSPLAALRVVQPLPDGDATIQIHDGTNRVDVTPYFIHEQSGVSVSRGLTNTVTGITQGNELAVHTFGLVNGPGQPLAAHFEVSGLARISFASIVRGQTKVIGVAAQFKALVYGTGDVGGTNAVFQGVVNLKGSRVEIIPGP